MSSIKIGNPNAYILLQFKNMMDLQNIQIPYIVFGAGTNIYFSEKIFPGTIIQVCFCHFFEWIPGVFLASSGLMLMDLIKNLANRGYDISNMSGIPGTLGGAIIGNAGAYGQEMGDMVFGIFYMESRTIKFMSQKDIGFDYRSTRIKNRQNFLILYAIIIPRLKKNADEINFNINRILRIRDSKLPDYILIPNMGCIFKNKIIHGLKIPAATLIQNCFDKDYTQGGLTFYNKHFNIIINPQKKASIRDLELMIHNIKENVFKKYGILLETEVSCLY